MKRGGGKAKGSAFERQICKALSEWVTRDERTDVFWRSAMSGGRATVAQRKGVNVRQAGDITAVAPEGHVLTDQVYIEAKHYKNLQIDSFFIPYSTGILAGMWRHTRRMARQHHRAPMMIAKQNMRPTLVITDRGLLNRLVTPGSVRMVSTTVVDDIPVTVCLFEHLMDADFALE